MNRDPNDLTPEQFARSRDAALMLRSTRDQARSHRFDSAVRLDAGERAPCLCYTGLGANRGKHTCMRSLGFVDTEHGPRARVEPCNPNEDQPMNHSDALDDEHTNLDATDKEACEAMATARRVREAMALEAGRITPAQYHAEAIAWRADAKASIKPGGRKRALSMRLGERLRGWEWRALRRSCGGADPMQLSADKARDLLKGIRTKGRAYFEADDTKKTNTDAAEVTDIERLRAQRDAQLAGAWKGGAA